MADSTKWAIRALILFVVVGMATFGILDLWHYAREGGVGGFEDFSYSLPDVDESALDQSSSASGSANDAPVSSARDARPVLAQLYLDSGGYLRLFASSKPVTEQSLAAPSKSGGGTQAEAKKPIADEPQSKTGVDYLQSAQAPKKETISACNCDPSVLKRAHEASKAVKDRVVGAIEKSNTTAALIDVLRKALNKLTEACVCELDFIRNVKAVSHASGQSELQAVAAELDSRLRASRPTPPLVSLADDSSARQPTPELIAPVVSLASADDAAPAALMRDAKENLAAVGLLHNSADGGDGAADEALLTANHLSQLHDSPQARGPSADETVHVQGADLAPANLLSDAEANLRDLKLLPTMDSSDRSLAARPLAELHNTAAATQADEDEVVIHRSDDRSDQIDRGDQHASILDKEPKATVDIPPRLTPG